MLSKLLSLAAALPFGAAWAGDEPPAGQELVLGPTASCPSSIPVSCRNTTAQRDLCCFEAPGVSAIQGERIAGLMSRHAGSSATDPGELTISSEHDKGANEADSSGIQTPAQDLRTHGPYTDSGLTSESHTLFADLAPSLIGTCPAAMALLMQTATLPVGRTISMVSWKLLDRPPC